MDSRIKINENLSKIWKWCSKKVVKKKTWIIVKVGTGSTEICLRPGQLMCSRESAGKELNMKPSTFWWRLKKIEKIGVIKIESSRLCSILTIIKKHKQMKKK